jgi:microcin C transport system substrate-binding protein
MPRQPDPAKAGHPNRRAVIAGGAAAAVLAGLRPAQASVDWSKARHGLSFFGDLKQPPDFKHFGYVNPAAPKGGTISMQISSTSGNQNFNTFNSFNIYILKGDGAAGVGSIFDTLMGGTGDEPDAMYGIVAESVLKTDDKPEWRFKLRKEARFHDGSPLTAADVAFSLELMKTKAHPSYQQLLRDLVAAEAEAPDVLRVELKPNPPRDLIMTVAGMPIFSKAYYSVKNFEESTLEPPLGSGPYKIGRFEVGRFVAERRVPLDEEHLGRPELPILERNEPIASFFAGEVGDDHPRPSPVRPSASARASVRHSNPAASSTSVSRTLARERRLITVPSLMPNTSPIST